ncbi:protein kinase domain with FHA domain [Xenococcus sp. PCC 7305]|uniref:FHA domain-containing serine/threonine-protein kinase n=1 Tax=Xenococcus sp. PCC 7305 TaxID=102125 RepID=UPI0002AB9AD2|nr:FHA domain-containing serine/threonine-protein kinase [Xenococcus sp. PCC 7305]ELS03751.1 protein kinase domain with FHA domain [Xenococcus sp. PCC 7305]
MVTLTFLDPQTNKPFKSWKFSEQSTICIGRAPQNDIVLKDYFQVSRQHVELTEIDDQWELVNHGSNGTFVNSVLVDKTQLNNNDLIRLAGNGPLLRFELELNSEGISTVEDISPSPSAVSNCQHIGNSPDSIFCIHCGQALVDEKLFIGNYQVLRTLGRGGMGITYLVRDQDKTIDGAPLLLVLKEMNAEMLRVAKARELFEREARILKTLEHPNIPKYYDFFSEGEHKYLVMELIHGHDLEQFTYQKGTVDLQQAIKWMIEICGVLYYLHHLQPPLIHRDIKPANLILRNLDNRLMLLDFGAVKEFGTSRNTRIGVEGYSAPEQYRGEPCPQSDLYGVGATLFFLLTGKTPMQSYVPQKNQYELDFASISSLSLELTDVLIKTCKPNPQDRYQSAQELAFALQRCL